MSGKTNVQQHGHLSCPAQLTCCANPHCHRLVTIPCNARLLCRQIALTTLNHLIDQQSQEVEEIDSEQYKEEDAPFIHCGCQILLRLDATQCLCINVMCASLVSALVITSKLRISCFCLVRCEALCCRECARPHALGACMPCMHVP